MAIITLTTDFGLVDEFVGVMKGVILTIHPEARIVDLSHGVAPQDVAGASDVLAAAYSYFPEGTIHVAVVDPGVGTDRRVLAVEAAGRRFVAPDNGLLGFVLKNEGKGVRVFSVENRRLFLDVVSRTFHGRDVFAPVAAHLAAGVPLESVGPELSPGETVSSARPGPVVLPNGEVAGHVTAVDRFGNLITDLSDTLLARAFGPDYAARLVVRAAGREICGVSWTYAGASPREPVLVIGSRGVLEIAVNQGSAARSLGLGKGAEVSARTS